MPNKTITQIPVAAKNIKRITIEPDTIIGEIVVWKVRYDYDPIDDQGVSIRIIAKSKSMTLSGGAQTTLQNFVTNQIVLDANIVEGT